MRISLDKTTALQSRSILPLAKNANYPASMLAYIFHAKVTSTKRHSQWAEETVRNQC